MALLVAVTAAVPVLAACGAGSSGTPGPLTSVLGVSVTRPAVTCGGWFEMTGSTLSATVNVAGPARSVTVTAMLDDGTTAGPPQPALLRPGAGSIVLRVRDLTSNVTGVVATVTGAAAPAGVECPLTNPH